MDVTSLQSVAQGQANAVLSWLVSPQFYVQIVGILAGVLAAFILARQFARRLNILRKLPQEGRALKLRRVVFSCRDLVFPILTLAALALVTAGLEGAGQSAWLVRIAQSAAAIYVLYVAINRFLTHPLVNLMCRWIGLPIAILAVLGYFDDFTLWLDTVAFSAGNIRISALALAKAAVFGGILFWLGRLSTSAGQRAIRDQEALDIQTRELVAKVLEIGIYIVVGLLLLNILGLDLTTLAVLGGAVGVGLGFGLQQIAANLISGFIILFERSLKIGDYIEMEDGKGGTLREINMRSSTLSTGDGKDIMIPNERFVTTRFTNWTKTDRLQKYEVPFHVAYDCDPRKVQKIVMKALGEHPEVLKAPHGPACELHDFAGHGIRMQASYWVETKDDDMDGYASEIRFLIWDALKAAKIAMPVAKEAATL